MHALTHATAVESARVCAATLSDIDSAVIAAIGILRGPLFGGGNEVVMELIECTLVTGLIKALAKQVSQSIGDTRLLVAFEAVERS